MRTLGNTVAGGVVGDVAHGLPMEEREDRDAVRARREAKRGQLLAKSPFAGLATAGAAAAYGTRSDVDPRTEERFATPAPVVDVDEVPPAPEPRPKPGRKPREIPAEVLETIRRLYGEGRSQREIAEHLGGAADCWTQKSVSTVMARHGIVSRPRGGRGGRDPRGPATGTPAVAESAHEIPVVELPPLAILETPAALAAAPVPALADDLVGELLAALDDALDSARDVVLAELRNTTDRLRARAVANRPTAEATRGRTA